MSGHRRSLTPEAVSKGREQNFATEPTDEKTTSRWRLYGASLLERPSGGGPEGEGGATPEC